MTFPQTPKLEPGRLANVTLAALQLSSRIAVLKIITVTLYLVIKDITRDRSVHSLCYILRES